MMMTGVGFDAHVAKKISPALKRRVGMGAYIWTTLVELFRYAPRRYEVTFGGLNFRGLRCHRDRLLLRRVIHLHTRCLP